MTSEAEALAQRFHETYERLAPGFGYKTRDASVVPWAAVPEQNKALMISVCAELLGAPSSDSLEVSEIKLQLREAKLDAAISAESWAVRIARLQQELADAQRSAAE